MTPLCLCVCVSLHPEVSYAQGMNDLCSRFLEVLDSEVDTFWSFSCYMERFNKDFMADGLHRKIGGVHKKEVQLYAKDMQAVFQNVEERNVEKRGLGPLVASKGY